MIYVDTSVALAKLFGEDRRPPDEFWSGMILSSRLLQYETWTRAHARGVGESHAEQIRVLLDGITFIEMHAPALERALEPLPIPVRTLDAMHLATMDFLKQQGQPVRLASYDDRLIAAARAMDFAIAPL